MGEGPFRLWGPEEWLPDGPSEAEWLAGIAETSAREPDWPDPHSFVDPSWDQDQRSTVARHLECGVLCLQYRGLSPCRFCERNNGSAEYTDGVYVWPEGLAHYVIEHGVRLPEEFVAHVLSSHDASNGGLRRSTTVSDNEFGCGTGVASPTQEPRQSRTPGGFGSNGGEPGRDHSRAGQKLLRSLRRICAYPFDAHVPQRPRRSCSAASSSSSMSRRARGSVDHEQARVAAAEQLVVEALAVEVHVGEPAAVDVVALDVVLEPHDLPEQPSARVRRRLGPEALHRLVGWCVSGVSTPSSRIVSSAPPRGGRRWCRRRARRTTRYGTSVARRTAPAHHASADTTTSATTTPGNVYRVTAALRCDRPTGGSVRRGDCRP